MSKTKRVVTNQNGFGALSQTKNIFSRHQAFGLWAIRRAGLQPNRVYSSLSERKMPPWIDDWLMSHFHLWDWECSHSSAVMSCHDWNVFLCMSLCEINKRVKGKKRTGESAMMRVWLQYSSSHQMFHWRVPWHPHLSGQHHSSFILLYNTAGVSPDRKHSSPPHLYQLLRSFHKM